MGILERIEMGCVYGGCTCMRKVFMADMCCVCWDVVCGVLCVVWCLVCECLCVCEKETEFCCQEAYVCMHLSML